MAIFKPCLYLLAVAGIALVSSPPPAETRPPRLSDLDDWLLDLISELSVNKVCGLCRALLRHPPAEAPLVAELAQLGSAGVHTSNQERDLHKLLDKKPWRALLPDLYEFDNFVTRKQEGAGSRRIKSHALLPHEVFANVWKVAPDLFDYLFRGGDDNMLNFWRETKARSRDWHDSHPAIQRQPDPLKRVPIGTHGDDTGIWQHEKVLVLSWNSVAVDLDTSNNRIVFAVVQLLSALPGVTLYEYYLVLKWSLNCLNEGKFPKKDHP